MVGLGVAEGAVRDPARTRRVIRRVIMRRERVRKFFFMERL